MKIFLSILSLVIEVFGTSLYCREILKGSVKPNRVSHSLWFFFPIPGLWAQYVKGFTLETIFIFVAILLPIGVIACSYIAKDGYWKISQFDIVLGLLSISVFIVSILLTNIYLAMTATIVSDFLAATPTIRKSWIDPHSEAVIGFLSFSIAGFLSVLTSKNINYVNTGFSIYGVFIGLLIAAIIFIRQKAIKKV